MDQSRVHSRAGHSRLHYGVEFRDGSGIKGIHFRVWASAGVFFFIQTGGYRVFFVPDPRPITI